MMVVRNAFFVLLFPALLLMAGGVLVFAVAPTLPRAVAAALPGAPYILGLGAMVLGTWFKCPRVVLMALLIAGAHWAVGAFVPDLETAGARGPQLIVVYGVIAVLFPFNAALIALKRDRGLWTRSVAAWVAFLVIQVTFLVVVWDAGVAARNGVDVVFHARLFDKAFDYWSLLPQPSIALFAVVVLGLFARAVWTGGAIDGGLFGALSLSAMALHAAGRGYLPDILFTMAMVTLLVALAQESYRLAFIDELTGLPGRRALMHDLQSLNGRYCVAMLDVDHFKKFNDTYGHDVGDQVLKLVASRMMRVKGGGRAYRYGGEEFTVLFPRASSRDAVFHLDALRRSIASAAFRLRADDRPTRPPENRSIGTKNKAPARAPAKGHPQVGVTISIGVYERADADTPDMAMKAADEALYRAKDGGRNRVSL